MSDKQPQPKTEKRSFKLINDRLSFLAGLKPPYKNKFTKIKFGS